MLLHFRLLMDGLRHVEVSNNNTCEVFFEPRAEHSGQNSLGALRGVGLQHIGAVVNIVAYYLIALPLGITLAFRTTMGLMGLWLGQVSVKCTYIIQN